MFEAHRPGVNQQDAFKLWDVVKDPEGKKAGELYKQLVDMMKETLLEGKGRPINEISAYCTKFKLANKLGDN